MLANKFTPTAHSPAPQVVLYKKKRAPETRREFLTRTHRFLILFFGAAGFLGFLNDSVEREAEAAHTREVGHVDVKLQLLVPQGLGAHRHLRGRHHLAEELAAVEQTGLHHELEGGTHTHTHTQ